MPEKVKINGTNGTTIKFITGATNEIFPKNKATKIEENTIEAKLIENKSIIIVAQLEKISNRRLIAVLILLKKIKIPRHDENDKTKLQLKTAPGIKIKIVVAVKFNI